ncbi:MAG: hypothetical protein ACI3XG_00795 [Faecousia sp.]
MRRFLFFLFLLFFFSVIPNRASAQELTAPTVSAELESLMPEEDASFGDGLLSILQKVLPSAYVEISQALKTGLAVFCCVFLVSILQSMGCSASAAEVAGAVCISTLMLRNSRALIGLAVETITEISEYSKLFLPVIAAASSAQGGITSATALCVGTSVFTAVLTNVLRRILIPVVYLFLAAAVANCAVGEEALKQIRDQLKKLSAWFLKTVLVIFLTYMSITGAVTGTADKTAVKAAKAAISTVVPVIGKTLADASESLLLSAGLVKNSIGIYGIFAFAAIFLLPFLRIGVHYLMMKGTAALCAIVGSKRLTELTEDFCSAMGLLLGMTGTMCALSIIGTVCFLKGAG